MQKLKNGIKTNNHMILYSTMTSERATKTQGGNDYICIKLTVQNGAKRDYPIGEIILDYNDDAENHGSTQNEWVLKYLGFRAMDPIIIDQGNVEPPKKGEKQKGDNCGRIHANKC